MRPSGVHLTRWCTREPANRRPRLMGRYRTIVPAPYIGLPSTVHTKLNSVTAGESGPTDWALRHAVLRVHENNWAILGRSGHGRGFMHGRREKTPQRALALFLGCLNVTWRRRRRVIYAPLRRPAAAPSEDSDRIGLRWGAGACTFLGRDSP